MADNKTNKGFEWQVRVWDEMSDVYPSKIDPRFTPVIAHLIKRADLQPGLNVLDLGTGTGAAAFECASRLGADGRVTAIDISPKMLAIARARAKAMLLYNIAFVEGSAEKIPAPDQSHDIVLASLSMMFVIDRAKAAREIARVLRPSGKFIASVWAGPAQADIIKFQQIAGSFAPKPPIEGVGPGALGDPEPFIEQLSRAGLKVKVETEVTEFEFENLQAAWDSLASVTASGMDSEILQKAKSAIRQGMWPDENKPRVFRNATHYISATKPEK